MAARPGIPHKIRFDIYRRDNFTCQYCGATPNDGAKLVIDHIYPVALGGKNEESNYVTSCSKCNTAKRDWCLTDDNVLTSDRGVFYGLTKNNIDIICEISKMLEMTFYDTSKTILRWYFEYIDGIRNPQNNFLKPLTDNKKTIIEIWAEQRFKENKEYHFNPKDLLNREHAQLALDKYTLKRVNEYCDEQNWEKWKFTTMFFDVVCFLYKEEQNG